MDRLVALAPPVDPEGPQASSARVLAVDEALAALQTPQREGAARRLEAWLKAVQAGPDVEAVATRLVDLLERRALAGLRRADGGRLEALALEALLRLGYPYALSLTPEAFAAASAGTGWRQRLGAWTYRNRRRLAWAGLVALAWGVMLGAVWALVVPVL